MAIKLKSLEEVLAESKEYRVDEDCLEQVLES